MKDATGPTTRQSDRWPVLTINWPSIAEPKGINRAHMNAHFATEADDAVAGK